MSDNPLDHPFARFALAHLAAYGIAFLWAAASMPVLIPLFIREIDALEGDMPAIGLLIAHRSLVPAGVAFVLPHLFAIPWIFAKDPPRWRRPTWTGIAAVAALGLVFGAGGWIWLVFISHGR
jgi:hypothetical protein